MADSAGRTRCRRRHRLKSRAASSVASPCNHQRPAANFNAGRSTLRSPQDMAARMDVYFLTACQIMSLQDATPMFRAFHLRGEDVVVDILDELGSRFREAMDAVKIRYG